MYKTIISRFTLAAVIILASIQTPGYGASASERRALMKKTLQLKMQKETGTPLVAEAPPLQPSPVTTSAPAPALQPQPESTPAVEPTVTKAPVQVSDELLELIPADSLFCVRVNNLDTSLMAMDQYLAGVSPIVLSMMAKMQLGQMLKDPMMTNIDSQGSFAIFAVVLPEEGNPTPEPVISLLVPVKNANHTFAVEGIKLANEKYALFNPELRQPERTQQLQQKLNAVKMISILDAQEFKRATTAPLWVYGNVPQIMTEYGEAIEKGLSDAKDEAITMQEIVSQDPNAPAMMMDTTAVFDMYFSLFETLLNDASHLSLAMTPSAEQLDLEYAIATKPGTETAKWLTSTTPHSGYKLAGLLDGTDAFNMVAKMDKDSMQAMNDFFMNAFMAENSEIFNEKWADLMKRSTAATGDELAMAFSFAEGQPPISFTEIVAVTDQQEYRDVMAETWTMVNEMYQSMGLPMTFSFAAGVEEYKGLPIDSALLEFNFPEDDPSAAVINSIYGDGLEYKMTVTEKALIMALGPEASEQIKTMIDKTKAGPASPKGDLKIAFDTIENSQNAEFIASYNILKLASSMGNLMKCLPIPPAQAMIAGAMFENFNAPTQSCLAVAGSADKGKLSIHVALPKKHLQEITTAAMTAAAKMQMQQATPAPAQHQHLDHK